MEMEIYNYSLCVSLTLMLFFACRFIFGKLPDKPSVKYYKRSRMLMGAALVTLSINYSIHLFVTPRLDASVNAILINLCTYWLAVWLFGSAMMILLDRSYVTRKRFVRYIISWVVYCLTAHALWRIPLPATLHKAVPVLLAVLFLAYAIKVTHHIFATLRRTVKMLDNYYADNASAYIRWMSVFTYWAVFFGVGQGIFTFIPDRYVFIWIISAIPFYIYLYVSYANYFLLYEQVEDAISQTEPTEDTPADSGQASADGNDGTVAATSHAPANMSKAQETFLEQQICGWVDAKEYTKGGLTIEDIARATGTNRTYISSFVNVHYGMTFREWINSLRLEYAKRLMSEKPDMPLADVAAKAGYLSPSYFSRTFKETEGLTPGKWIERNSASNQQ